MKEERRKKGKMPPCAHPRNPYPPTHTIESALMGRHHNGFRFVCRMRPSFVAQTHTRDTRLFGWLLDDQRNYWSNVWLLPSLKVVIF